MEALQHKQAIRSEYIEQFTPSHSRIMILNNGWNAVGYPATANLQRDTALNTLTFGNEVDSIWYFHTLNETWQEIGPSDYLIRGRGYWVHATKDCEWRVP
jgi:hypothetical protein